MTKRDITAADVIKALEKRPDLLESVKAQLAEPQVNQVAWTLLSVEHEFGQRDEGWSLFPTQEAARVWKEEHEGGTVGQYFTYEGPKAFEVTAEVWKLLKEKGRLNSKSNSLPKKGTVITMGLIR